MRRVFAVIGFPFAFASIIAVRFSYVGCAIIAALALITLVLSLSIESLKKEYAIPTAMVSVIAAALLFCINNAMFVAPVLQYDGTETTVNAVCLDYGSSTDSGYEYLVSVKSTDKSEMKQSFKLKVFSRTPLYFYPDETVSFRATLSSKYASIYGDYGEGVYLSAYFNDSDKIVKTGEMSRSVNGFFQNISHTIKDKLSQYLDEDEAALNKGFLFSDKSEISADVKNAFNSCGLQHTLAVSGLHLSIIIGTLYSVLMMLCKNKRKTSVICIISTVLFMFVVGFHYSALRSGIMMIILYVGNLFGKRSDGVNSLSIALTVFCVMNPYAAVNISFLMSFCATLVMILIFTPIQKYLQNETNSAFKKWILKICFPFVQSVVANIAILPIIYIFFGSISIISPLANMIILPIISLDLIFVVVFALFSFIPFAAAGISFIISGLTKAIIWLCVMFAKLPVTTVAIGENTFGFWIAACIIMSAVCYILIAKGEDKRNMIRLTSLICINLLLVSVFTSNIVKRNDISVSMLDVGNGVCSVVNCGGDVVVIGAGGDNAEYELVNFFKAHGAVNFHALVLPNGENRYSKSAANVVKYNKPDLVLMNKSDDSFYSVKSVYDGEINDVANSVLTMNDLEIRTTESGAVYLKYRNMKMLFVDKSVNIESLPDYMKTVDIAVVNGNRVDDFDMINADNVIFCTNRQDFQYVSGQTVYLADENNNLTVNSDGFSMNIKNKG